METLRKNELRASIEHSVKALAVSEGSPCILEALASTKGLSVTSNYAMNGAGESAGKTAATVAAPAIDFGAFELEDEIRRRVAQFATIMQQPMTRVSATLRAYSAMVTKEGDDEQLAELYSLVTRWVTGFERLHGDPVPQAWGWPCPSCGALYSETDRGMELAPVFGGGAVVIGDWAAYCIECSFVMSKSLAGTRARRHEARLAGSTRLAKKWRSAIKGSRYDLMTANAAWQQDGEQADADKAVAAGERLVWLIQQLHNGGYLQAHGTAEEKAAAAAKVIHTA